MHAGRSTMTSTSKSVIKTVLCSGLLLASINSYADTKEIPAPQLSPAVMTRIQKLMDNPATWQKIPKDLTLCVFSPEGAKGKAFEQAMSYLTEVPKYTQIAKNIGVNINVTLLNPLNLRLSIAYPKLKKSASTDVKIRIYTDERVLAEDFKLKKCDGAGMSNMRARQFNPFVGSIDAVGALLTYNQVNEAINLLARPEFANRMINKDYEVVGIVPLGAAYVMVNDRAINTLSKAAGRKVAVFDVDKTQAKLAQRIGAQPIAVDLTSIGGKFNNGEVEIMAGPALLFKPLELYKGMMGSNGQVKGAIIRFPVMQVTGALMMQRGKFPDGLGQIVREVSAANMTPAYNFIHEVEADIPANFWMDVPEADQPGYLKMMRESRLAMTQEGHYDKSMMQFLKRVRCKFAPTNYECSLNDE